MTDAIYQIQVDWNDDLDFSDTLEDLTSRTYPGIKASLGRDQIRSLSPPAAGEASFDVNNQDGALSPENTGSQLASYLYPGHRVRIRASFGSYTYEKTGVVYNQPAIPYNGPVYSIFQGLLDDIKVFTDLEDRRASLPVLGSLSRLFGKTISTALYQNIRTDEAIGYLLDAAGWPVADRVISTGDTTLAWFYLDGADAGSALVDLVNTEGAGASVWEDGDSKIHFENKLYRTLAARSTSPVATFSALDLEPVIAKGLTYDPSLKNIINSASCTVNSRAIAGSLTVVWSLGSVASLAALETRTFTARQSSGIPFTQAVAPVGGGTDYTVSVGAVTAVTLDRTSGASVTISITAGAAGATITGLQLRAKLVDKTSSTTVTNSVDASASIAKYGTRIYPLRIYPELDVETARSQVNAVVLNYKEPRPIIRFSVICQPTNTARLLTSLARSPSDRITISANESFRIAYESAGKTYNQASLPYSGANAVFTVDAYIEHISHDISQGKHIITFGCEKAPSLGTYPRWDSATWNGNNWGY